jgi:hypothetical protein
MNLALGRWRSQTLHAGVELGVFNVIENHPKHVVEIVDQLDLDQDNAYRLLRAPASVGVLEETPERRFSLTDTGELLQEDHPDSLAGFVRLEEGPMHYAIWKHLPDIVREGKPNGFQREFGHRLRAHGG